MIIGIMIECKLLSSCRRQIYKYLRMNERIAIHKKQLNKESSTRVNQVKSAQHRLGPTTQEQVEDLALKVKRLRTSKDFTSTNQLKNPEVKKPKKQDDQRSDFSEDEAHIASIDDKENFQKLLKLTQTTRQALKKIQRFDRFIYAHQAEKVCKDVVTAELKRIEKRKNLNKKMRVMLFDNELTITAIYNLLRILSEMKQEYQQFKIEKAAFEAEQKQRKKAKFKANIESKRNKNSNSSKEQEMAQLAAQIDMCIVSNELDQLKIKLDMILKKFEHEPQIENQIVIYRSLLEQIQARKKSESEIFHLKSLIELLLEINANNIDEIFLQLESQREQTAKKTKLEKVDSAKTLGYLNSIDHFLNKIIEKYPHTTTLRSPSKPNRFQNKKLVEPKVKDSQANLAIAKLTGQIEELNSKIKRIESENEQSQKLTLLNEKLLEISEKIDSNKNWYLQLNAIANNSSLSTLKITPTLTQVLRKLKQPHKENLETNKNDLLNFLVSTTQIMSNNNFSIQRKKVQAEKLMKKYGISDQWIIDEYQLALNSFIKQNIEHMTQSNRQPNRKRDQRNDFNEISQPQKSLASKPQTQPSGKQKNLSDLKLKQTQKELSLANKRISELQNEITAKQKILEANSRQNELKQSLKSLQKQKSALEGRNEKLQKQVLSIEEELKSMKALDQSSKLIQSKLIALMDKIKNGNSNWPKQWQRFKKQKIVNENPLALLFLQFDEELSKVQEAKSENFMKNNIEMLQQLLAVYENNRLSSVQRKKEASKKIDAAIKKNSDIDPMKSHLTNLLEAAVRRGNQQSLQQSRQKQLENKIALQANEISKLKEEQKNLLNKIKQNDSNEARLGREVDELKYKIASNQAQFNHLKKENQSFLDRIAEKQRIQRKLDEQNKSLLNRITSNEIQIKHTAEQNKYLQNRIIEGELELRKLAEENKNLQSQIEKYQSAMSNKRHIPIQTIPYEQLMPNHQEQINRLKEQLSEKNKEKQQSSNELQKLTEAMGKNLSLNGSNVKGPRKNDIILNQINRYIVQQGNQREKEGEFGLIREILRYFVQVLQSQRSLEDEIADLELKLSISQELNERNKKKQNIKAGEIEKYIEQLEAQIKQYRDRNSQLTRNIRQLEAETRDLAINQEDLKNIENIAKRIQEGGEWWKLIPRRTKKAEAFSPIYNLLEYCKNQQIERSKHQSERSKSPKQFQLQIDDYLHKLQQLQRENEEMKRSLTLIESQRPLRAIANKSTGKREAMRDERNYKKLYEELKKKEKKGYDYQKQFMIMQDEMMREIDALKEQLENERGENVTLSVYENMVKKFDEAQIEIDSLQRINVMLRSEVEKLKTERKKHFSEQEGHKQSARSLEQQLLKMKATSEKMKREIHDFKERQKLADEVIDKLQKQKLQMIESNKSKGREVEWLVKGIKAHEEKYTAIEQQLQKLLEQKNGQIKKLRKQIEAKSDQIDADVFHKLLNSYEIIGQQLRKQRAQKEQQAKQSKQRMSALAEKHEKIMQMLEQQNQQLKSEKKQQNNWANKYAELQAKYRDLEKINKESMFYESQEWQKNYQDLLVKYEKLTRSQKASKGKLEQLEAKFGNQIAQWESEKLALKIEKEDIRRSGDQAKRNFQSKLLQQNSLMKQIEAKFVNKHESEKYLLKNQTENEINGLKSHIATLERKLTLEVPAEKQSLKANLTSLKAEVEHLLQQNQKLRNYAQNEHEINGLRSHIATLERKLTHQIPAEKQSLKMEVQQLRQENEKLQNYAQNEHEINGLRSHIATLEKKLTYEIPAEKQNLKMEVEQLRRQNEKLRNYAQNQHEINELRSHIGKLEKKLTLEVPAEKQSLKAEIEQLRQQNEKLKNYAKNEHEISELKSHIAATLQKKLTFDVPAEKEGLMNNLANLRAQIEHLRSENEKLMNQSQSDQVAELKSYIATLEKKLIHEIPAEKQSLKASLTSLRAEVEQLRKQNDKLRNQSEGEIDANQGEKYFTIKNYNYISNKQHQPSQLPSLVAQLQVLNKKLDSLLQFSSSSSIYPDHFALLNQIQQTIERLQKQVIRLKQPSNQKEGEDSQSNNRRAKQLQEQIVRLRKLNEVIASNSVTLTQKNQDTAIREEALKQKISELEKNSSNQRQIQSKLRLEIANLLIYKKQSKNESQSSNEQILTIRKLQAKQQELNEEIRILKINVNLNEALINSLKDENLQVGERLKKFEEKEKKISVDLQRISSDQEDLINRLTNENAAYQEMLKEQQLREKELRNDLQKLLERKSKKQEDREIELELSDEQEDESSQYNETELEILKRINLEIANLVEVNRKLQLKIALLEIHSHRLDHECIGMINYFMVFQDKMERLMGWLTEHDYIRSGHSFAEFCSRVNKSLNRSSSQQYMGLWLEFMKSLFSDALALKQTQFRVQEISARQSPESRVKSNIRSESLLDLKKLRVDFRKNQDEILLEDIRLLLGQYLETANSQYLKMMAHRLSVSKRA